MKKQICYSILSLAFAMFSISANAQQSNSDIVKASPSQESFISEINTPAIVSPSESSKISASAISNFENSFKDAKEVKWSTIKNGNFVTFVVAGQKSSAVYNNNGKLNYSITTLNNSNIPANLQQLIKNEYAAYTVTSAIEINTSGNLTTQVILKSSKDYVTIKSNGDDVEVNSVNNASAVK